MMYSMEWILKEELEEARNKGWNEGKREGERSGERKGEKKILLLLQHLQNNGQQNLVPEILKNEALKEELYQKFNI